MRPCKSARQLQTTDARNETGEYTHDALNRVTEIEYGDDTVTLGYDAGTNGHGRLTSVTNGASNTSFSYDAVGRVTGRSQTTGSVTLDIGYDYDSYGRLESLTTPSGQVLSYEYQDGRVSGLKLNGSYLLSDIHYQPLGPTTGWTWGNATTTSRVFDTDGQLVEVSSAGVSNYTYNDDGTIATRSDDFASDLSWSDGTTTFAVSSSSNRLQSATGEVSRSYGYDAAGNTTSDGSRTFTYNDAGRMKTSTAAGVTTTYSYNGFGERVKKTNSSSTTYFAHDEAGHLIGEYDAAGELVEETVWFGDIPVAVLKPNGGSGISVFYIHTDHLNTPRRITRPSDNAIVWRWDSDPFGDTAADDDPDSDMITFAYHLRFPGQYFDAETGLHYNYFRDYDAVAGRYIQSDPIGLAGGINTYAYVGGNPVRNVDPFGLRWVPCEHIARGAQCWVPDPAYDRIPRCATAECAAGILPNRNQRFSWGVGGCLGTSCVEYDSRDSAPGVSVPFPPDLGGGFSLCTSEVPKDSCGVQRDLNVGLGRFLGLSFGNDGTVCLNIGAAIASPLEVTLGTGKLLW